MHFEPAWVKDSGTGGNHETDTHFKNGTNGTERLNEGAYFRQTRASERNVLRLHSAMSNRFKEWVKRKFGVVADQERNRVDVTFTRNGVTQLAELKICYGSNTRAAIREALGQLLEYNHYPPRTEAERWWLVLDQQPRTDDLQYLDTLCDAYHFPLTTAWAKGIAFETHNAFAVD
jgi:hypothetical protein